jgi:hypothetical protein
MVEAINHDATSTVATVGGEAAKGGLIGGAIAIFGGAALGAVALAVFAPALVGLGAVIGGIAGATMGAAPLAAIGGLFGIAKGGDKVNTEQQAFRDRVRGGPQAQAEIAGVQQGYQIGLHDGQQMGFQQGAQYGAQAVITQVQQHVAAQQQAMATAQPQVDTPVAATSEAKTGFADKVASCHCESHVGKVEGDRAQAAAASAQIG